MINSLFLQSLRNSEFIQFITEVLTTVANADPAALNVKPAYDALLAVKNETENLYKISQSSPVTEEIEALDARRDAAITGITLVVNGFAYSYDAGIKNHAKALGNHLAMFGSSIARDNYQSETNNIRNIIADWDAQPALVAAISELQLTNWKAELQDANNAFTNAYRVRSVEMGSASPENLKNQRNLCNTAYYQLRDKLNAHFTLSDGAEPFASAINTINSYVLQFNNLLGSRGANVVANPVVVNPA